MILNTKTGLVVGGTLIKDAEVRELRGGKQKLSFPLRYGWEEPAEPGVQRTGKLLDVDIWDGIAALDGMLKKGDAVIAVADEVKSREYGGKTYHSISPTGLFVSAAVTQRWMQQVLDLTGSMVDELRAENATMRAEIAQIRQAPERAGGRILGKAGVPSTPAALPPEGQEVPVRQTPPVTSGGAQDPSAGGSGTEDAAAQQSPGSLAGHELYEGEQLTDHAPPWGVQGGPAARREDPRRSGGRLPAPNHAAAEPCIDEAEDLPF